MENLNTAPVNTEKSEVNNSEQEVNNSEQKKLKKTYQEKAKEKNYYQDENGDWWEKLGEGGMFDERVDSFKLDVEYPDLADKTEELAQKYEVKFVDDPYGFKREIYNNAEKLNKADDEHLRNLFLTRAAITGKYGDTEKKLVGYEPEKLDKIIDALNMYYWGIDKLMPEAKEAEGTRDIAETLVRSYDDKLIEGDFLKDLSATAVEACKDEQHSHDIVEGAKDGVEGLGINEQSGSLFGGYMDYYTELLGDEEKITKWNTKSEVLSHYVMLHGVKNDTVAGFRDVIFPLLEQGEPELEGVINGGNAWGDKDGTYGIADYEEECLLSRYRPPEIDRLVRIYHEIPTSDFAKFEQNRKDAARIEHTIIGGRDFIHDEKAGAHEVLKAIQDFYDHRDEEDSYEYRSKVYKLDKKYGFGVLPNAYHLDEYEKPVEKMSEHNKAEKGDPNERAIDILRRLVENTAPDTLEVPQTKDEKLNELMQQIEPKVNEDTGEVRVRLDEVTPAIAEMNNLIRENSGKQGVFPSTVKAISYLNKMAAYALRSCEAKELPELPFDSGFKEVMRFAQLTSSAEYSDREFDLDYGAIQRMAGEAYGEDGVDRDKAREAWRMISQQIMKNVSNLGTLYNERKNTRRFSKAVWSGNLNDELIGTFERV